MGAGRGALLTLVGWGYSGGDIVVRTEFLHRRTSD